VVDHTASQGGLAYDQAGGLLIAVNPGSDTISVFGVQGDRLALREVLPSGGDFPVSVTVSGDHAYVLNALGGGSLSGYRIGGGRVTPLPGSHRALGLGTTAATQFTATPGQAAFTPDGRQLLVTTKATGNDVDVFAVGADGRLSAAPRVNALPGDVPFDVAFDPAGHVVLTEAGPNAVATFTLSRGGRLTQLAVADTGQMATCWVVRAGGYFYLSNAGSGTESGYRVGWSGGLTALGNTATDGGTVDAAAVGGRFVYVQTGKSGIVDEFAVGAGGALTAIGSVPVPGGTGGEGIAAA
jgi:DNA-binding beta-propeller fold protein YncE